MTLHPAYTVGLTTSYDRSLKEEPHPVKLGRRDDYPGGWVWKSPEEARTFLSTEAFRFTLPNRQPEEMSVYLLSLPSPWEECCTPYSEGVCRLLRDAPILCKV